MKHAAENLRTRVPGLLLGLALLSLLLPHAFADDTGNKQERAAQRRMQLLQMKFEQDKAALEQENAAIKEQLKESDTKLAAAQKNLAGQRKEIKKLKAEYSEKEIQLTSCQREADAVRNDLASTRQKLGEVTQHLRQSEARNKQLERDKSGLESALAGQKNEVHACQEKNARLLDMFREMVKKYEKEELKNVEPLSGLKGVGIENSFQDARDRAEAQLYQPRK